MALLAIKGHAVRGSEVIALLEMLGGINNRFKFDGLNEESIYYICPEYNNDIHSAIIPTDQIVFSLEEFEEKFPYKVGDKVWLHYENSTIRVTETITCMRWCDKCNCVLYDVSTCCNLREYAFTPYKEETMDRKFNVEEYLKVWEETEKGLEVVVNDKFELKEDNGKFYIIKKQLQYPKTYEECCEVLGSDPSKIIVLSNRKDIIHEENKHCYEMYNLYQLLICRDAYWKIAGTQLGLDKPWKPDWNEQTPKYTIVVLANELVKRYTLTQNFILAFPSEEMRDAFYENFKELIETCKELL